MKRVIYSAVFLLLFTFCNSQKKESFSKKEIIVNNGIKKIIFSEVNTSQPINSNSFEILLIEFSYDSISLVKEQYLKEQLVEKNVIKSYLCSNKSLFLGISKKHLNPHNYPYLNYSPQNDGGIINVNIHTHINTDINWKLNYKQKNLPEDIELVYKSFIEAKERLYK